MTRSFRFLLATTLALASLWTWGCTTSCDCPDPVYGMVVVPGDSSRSLGLVLTDELECIAHDSGAADGGRMVRVDRNGTGSCHVHAEFMNGDEYTFTVDFEALSGCCGYLSQATNMTVPVRVTAP